jgi:hypothetical protein
MNRSISKLVFAASVGALALVGCDQQGPQGPAGSPPKSSATTPSAGASTPLPSQQPPQPSAKSEPQTPVQGQADARESAQKQHFDNKG